MRQRGFVVWLSNAFNPAEGRPGDLRSALKLASGRLLLVLWPLELLHLLLGLSWLQIPTIFLFCLYMGLGLVSSTWGNKALATVLIGAIVTLLVLDGVWEGLERGLFSSMVFAAFLPAVYLLRHVVVGDRHVRVYRQLVSEAPPAQQPGWILVGSHVLGAALSVGALAVMEPAMASAEKAEVRRSMALAVVSGLSLSLLWSPMFVAIAVVSAFMVQVPLWQTMLIGAALASAGVLLALALLGIPDKGRVIYRATTALQPVIPVVAMAVGAVLLVVSTTQFSTLQAVSLTLPPLALLLLLRQPASNRPRVVASTRASLNLIGAEVSIVALAFTLATVMKFSPTVELLTVSILAPELPALLLISIIVGGMILGGVAGIHPIVTGSVLLAVFAVPESGLADLSIVGAVMLGWACGAMVAVAGLILMVATNMLRLSRREMILGRNLALVGLFAATGTLLLTLMNAVLNA